MDTDENQGEHNGGVQLPVDVAGVVNVHPRVAEGIGSIRTPRGLDLVYERMVHGECSA